MSERAEADEAARAAEDAPPGARTLTDAEIVLPNREVVCTDGRRFTIRPWGIENGAILLERLQELQPKLAANRNATVNEMLSVAWDEIVAIVSLTIGIDQAEMTKDPVDGGLTFEDLLGLTEAILEVCIVRSDGRGAVPLLIALVGQLTATVAQVAGPHVVAPRSKSSGKRASSGARSQNGSGSRKRRRNGKGARH